MTVKLSSTNCNWSERRKRNRNRPTLVAAKISLCSQRFVGQWTSRTEDYVTRLGMSIKNFDLKRTLTVNQEFQHYIKWLFSRRHIFLCQIYSQNSKPSCHSRRKAETHVCDPNDSTFIKSKTSLTRLSMVLSSKGCLRSKLTMVWVPCKQGLLVPIYHQKNCRSINFPTGNSNHDGSGGTTEPQTLHTCHRSKMYQGCEMFSFLLSLYFVGQSSLLIRMSSYGTPACANSRRIISARPIMSK